ncbi:MAG: hypothetical protein JWQ18_3037 [Conexibacter sp.]|nr:hypothetical protein [Conexibacter sp.]
MSPAAMDIPTTEGPDVLFSSRRARTALTVLAAVLLVSLLAAASALADSATISITDTTGKSDPVSGIPRTFTVSGTTSSNKNIYIKVRNPGPTPCAPTANTDSGDWWDGYAGGWDRDRGDGANGNFSFSDVYATGMTGTNMFCIWIADNPDQSVTAITQTITFRSPSGTISATINPVTPTPGQQMTITVNGVSEAPERVFALVRTAGVPCSQTYDADRNIGDETELFDGYSDSTSNVNGNYSISDTLTESTAGNYVLCLWLADSSSDTTPVAGPQPIPLTVASPPPPPPPPPPRGPSAECKAAKKKVTGWTKNVKTTKKSLLHARRKATRRKLTRRLKSQRTSLKSATRRAKVICG